MRASRKSVPGFADPSSSAALDPTTERTGSGLAHSPSGGGGPVRPELLERALPLRISPIDDESLAGYMVRLAERNAFERVGWLLDLAGIPAGRSMFFEPDLKRLSSLARVSVTVLECMRIGQSTDGSCLFRGRPIRRVHVRTRNRRLCPECLVASPHIRRCWDLSVVQVCPRHLLRLIERCEACSKAISWLNPGICHCRCGFDLRCGRTEPVRADHVGATGLLVDMLDMEPRLDVAAPLAELTFSGTVDLLTVLGGGEAQLAGDKRVTASRRMNPDFYRVIQDGLDCTEEWPARFHDLLASLRSDAPDRRGSYGLVKSFGRLHTAITLIEDADAKRVIGDAFRDFVRRNGDIGLTRRRSLLLSLEDRQQASHLTIKEASLQLRLSVVKVRRLIAAGLLQQVSERRGKGRPQLVLGEAVRRLAACPRWLLNRTEAMAELAVDRAVFDKLVERGIIHSIDRSSGTSMPWLIDRNEVTGLMAALERTCVEPGRREGTLPLRKASSFLFNAGKGLVDLIDAVRAGRFAIAGVDERRTGLERLLIDVDDLKRLADECRAAKPSLSAHQFASRAELHHDSVALLIKDGLIQGFKRGNGPRAHYRITEQGLQAFNTGFVSGPALARELHLDWRSLRCFLSTAGIEPIASPASGNSRTLVFARCSSLSEVIELRARTIASDDGPSAGLVGIPPINLPPIELRRQRRLAAQSNAWPTPEAQVTPGAIRIGTS